MLSTEAELAFPDFDKPFHLYTDASDVQLGATLVQDGKPLGFYTRKLNAAQLNYTVGEKELLGIVEGLKAFEGMVKGFDLIIHTDHLNLLYNKLPSQRMTRWRLLLEEFHPKVKHIAGPKNEAADCLSRNKMKHMPFDVIEWEPRSKPLEYCDEVAKDPYVLLTQVMARNNFEDEGWEDLFASRNGGTKEFEDRYPLSTTRLHQDQCDDVQLCRTVKESISKNEFKYTYKEVEGKNLIHQQGRILVPVAA